MPAVGPARTFCIEFCRAPARGLGEGRRRRFCAEMCRTGEAGTGISGQSGGCANLAGPWGRGETIGQNTPPNNIMPEGEGAERVLGP